MRKCKEGCEKSNSLQVIYPMVLLGTKLPLVHVVDALHTRVLLPGHQVSHKRTIWLATKARHEGSHQASLVTLMPPPLRSFSNRGGSPRPPHKASSALHTKLKGRRLAGEPPRLRGFGAPCTAWSTRESPHKIGTPCISLSTKPMLILHTLSMCKAFGYSLKH
jgi:hypothetical protein